MTRLSVLILVLIGWCLTARAQFSPNWPSTNYNTTAIGVTPGTNTAITGSTPVTNGTTSWQFTNGNVITFVPTTNCPPPPSQLSPLVCWQLPVEISNIWVKLYDQPIPANVFQNFVWTNTAISPPLTNTCVYQTFTASNYFLASGTHGTNTFRSLFTNFCTALLVTNRFIGTDTTVNITIDACLTALVVTNIQVITQSMATAICITNPGAAGMSPLTVAIKPLNCTITNLPQLIGSASHFLIISNQYGASPTNIYNWTPYTNASLQAYQFWPADTVLAESERGNAIGRYTVFPDPGPPPFQIMPPSPDQSTDINLPLSKAWVLANAHNFAAMFLADSTGDFTTWCNTQTNYTFNIANCGSVMFDGANFFTGTNSFITNSAPLLPPTLDHLGGNYPIPFLWLLSPTGTGLITAAQSPFPFSPLISGGSPVYGFWQRLTEASILDEYFNLPRQRYPMILTTNVYFDDLAGTGDYEDDGTPTQSKFVSCTQTVFPLVCDPFMVNPKRHFWQPAGVNTNMTGPLGHLVTNNWQHYFSLGLWFTNSSLTQVFTNPIAIAGNCFLNVGGVFVIGYSNAFFDSGNGYGIGANGNIAFSMKASNSFFYTEQITAFTNYDHLFTNRFTPGLIIASNCRSNLYTFPLTNIVSGVTNIITATNIVTDCFFTNVTARAVQVLENDYATNAFNLSTFAPLTVINSNILSSFTLTSPSGTNVSVTMVTTNWDVPAGMTEADMDWDSARRAITNLRTLSVLFNDGSWGDTNNRYGGTAITSLFDTNLYGGAALTTNSTGTLSSLFTTPPINYAPNQNGFAPGAVVQAQPSQFFRKDQWDAVTITTYRTNLISTNDRGIYNFFHNHTPANRTCSVLPAGFASNVNQSIIWSNITNDVWDTVPNGYVDTIGEYVAPSLVIVPTIQINMDSSALFWTDITTNFASARSVYIQGGSIGGVTNTYPVACAVTPGAILSLSNIASSYSLCDTSGCCTVPNIIEPLMQYVSIISPPPGLSISNQFYDPMLNTPVTGILTNEIRPTPAVWSYSPLAALSTNGVGQIATLASLGFGLSSGTGAVVFAGVLTNKLLGTMPSSVDGVIYTWGIQLPAMGLFDFSISNPPPGGFKYR